MTTVIHHLTQEHNSLKVRINRLRSQKMMIQNKLILQSKAERKARTRTLIQLGALVNMTGLTEMCDIVAGEDLQLDLTAQDKAATLLGILVTLVEQMPPALSLEQKQIFKQKGIQSFKFYQAKKGENRK